MKIQKNATIDLKNIDFKILPHKATAALDQIMEIKALRFENVIYTMKDDTFEQIEEKAILESTVSGETNCISILKLEKFDDTFDNLIEALSEKFEQTNEKNFFLCEKGLIECRERQLEETVDIIFHLNDKIETLTEGLFSRKKKQSTGLDSLPAVGISDMMIGKLCSRLGDVNYIRGEQILGESFTEFFKKTTDDFYLEPSIKVKGYFTSEDDTALELVSVHTIGMVVNKILDSFNSLNKEEFGTGVISITYRNQKHVHIAISDYSKG